MRLFTRDSLERMGVTTRSVQSERRPRVKLHRNAKTTPHMRALLVDRIRHQQWTPAGGRGAPGSACAAPINGWLAIAPAARCARGSRLDAAASAASHGAGVTARIVAARYERRTAWAIAVQLQVPRSTVAAIFARAGLNRLARLTPPPDHPVRMGAPRRPGPSRCQTARAHCRRRPPDPWRSASARQRHRLGVRARRDR